MVEPSGKFISIGMPGDECCSCELVLSSSSKPTLNFCGACNLVGGGIWTGAGPGRMCTRYPIYNWPDCATGLDAKLIQICPPIAGSDCTNTVVTTYDYEIVDSGICGDPSFFTPDAGCDDGDGEVGLMVCINHTSDGRFPRPNDCCEGVEDYGGGQWRFDCGGDVCDGRCSGAINLYGEEDGRVNDFCFPHTCCPCPESGGGSRTVSMSVTHPSGSFEKDFDLPYNFEICQSAFSAVGNVPCYNEIGIDNSGIRAEKYGATGLQLCEPSEGCSGQRVDMTLCCCEDPAAQGLTSGVQDCHICNYQFTMGFIPLNNYMPVPAPEGVKYCFCPSGIDVYGGADLALLPGDNIGGSGPKKINTLFTVVDGTCDPFYLEFLATGLYWNCDCLQGGDDEDVSNVAEIRVTIT